MAEKRETGSAILLRAFGESIRSLWQQRIGTMTIEGFQIAGKIVIVQEFDQGGWDAYVQASDKNRVDETIAAIAKNLGVDVPFEFDPQQAPYREHDHFYALGPGFWGRGKTESEAIINCRHAGAGQSKTGTRIIAYRVTAGTEFLLDGSWKYYPERGAPVVVSTHEKRGPKWVIVSAEAVATK